MQYTANNFILHIYIFEKIQSDSYYIRVKCDSITNAIFYTTANNITSLYWDSVNKKVF